MRRSNHAGLGSESERRFLKLERGADIRRMRFVLLITLPALTFSVFIDLRFCAGLTFGLLLALRAVNLVIGLALWRITYTRPERLHALLWPWLSTILLILLMVRVTRPPDALPATIWNLIALVLIYLAPLRLRGKVLGATFITICEGWVWVSLALERGRLEVSVASILFALFISHVVGVFLCRDSKRAKRDQLRLLKEVERAVAELKILQGIIPVCMHCKQVRNDEGAYEPIVDYVRARSEAEFSHGICPDCGEKHYPGLLEAAEEEQAAG